MPRTTATLFAPPFTILALMVLALPLSGCDINNIPTFEQHAKANWTRMQDEYRRRNDLIGELVANVDVLTSVEKSILQHVSTARGDATKSYVTSQQLSDTAAVEKFQSAQNELHHAVSQLMSAIGRDPNLNSVQKIRALRRQIDSMGYRISLARRDFINSVNAYNNELATSQGRWWRAVLYPGYPSFAGFRLGTAGAQNSQTGIDGAN